MPLEASYRPKVPEEVKGEQKTDAKRARVVLMI